MTDDKAKVVAATNGRAFIEAGGISLCVDLLTGAHEAREKSGALEVKTNMITDLAHDERRAEWYYYPEGERPEGWYHI